MKERRLSKNQELHWWNWFEEIFALLKVASLGVLVFKKVQGKKNCLASNFWCQKLEVKQKTF